jgi:hypothetical protein
MSGYVETQGRLVTPKIIVELAHFSWNHARILARRDRLDAAFLEALAEKGLRHKAGYPMVDELKAAWARRKDFLKIDFEAIVKDTIFPVLTPDSKEIRHRLREGEEGTRTRQTPRRVLLTGAKREITIPARQNVSLEEIIKILQICGFAVQSVAGPSRMPFEPDVYRINACPRLRVSCARVPQVAQDPA